MRIRIEQRVPVSHNRMGHRGLHRVDRQAGAARTQFRFGRAKLGPKVDVYNDTPAGMARRIFQDTSRLPQGEPAEMAKIDNDR